MGARNSLKGFLLNDNPVSRLTLAGYRTVGPARIYAPKLMQVFRWLIVSKETTNVTYDLTKNNLLYLAETISVVTGVPATKIEAFLSEPDSDVELLDHIRTTIRASKRRAISDEAIRFGRRLGWYAFVRATKPRLVIETGVDKGLGSVLLSAALLRNMGEGYPGSYLGTDINPDAGFLLSGKWAKAGRILYGDSIESLRTISDQVDLFINDSDHSAAYELAEYRLVRDKLSSKAILLGDNSHGSDSLARFSRESGLKFLFFAEQPANHWYPGAGIGIAFPETPAVPSGLDPQL